MLRCPWAARCRTAQPGGCRLVHRDLWGIDLGGVAAYQDDGEPSIPQRLIPGVVCSSVGVQAGDEQDAGDVALAQDLDVLVLGRAARDLSAQHGGEPGTGEQRLSLLRDGWEHRVGEFRYH